jgi:hypothetical protein
MNSNKESGQETRWERMMMVFYTKDIASIGVVFDANSKVEFQGKPVASIAICQYVPNTTSRNGNCSLAKMLSNTNSVTEPREEMNGVFVWYRDSGINNQPEKVDSAFLPEIITIINERAVSMYFIDKHYRDMSFWMSGASLDRCWYSSLEELEKYDKQFSAVASDDMCIPDDIAAHMYFEPKVRELVELIEGCSDASGKADAARVQKLLKRRLNLNDEEAWAVFDYALKLGLFEEVDNVYARATGKRPPALPGKYDLT